MALYIGSTVINVTNIEQGIAFWTAALGYRARLDDDETFAVLYDPAQPWVNLSLQLTDQPKMSVNRMHLDLYTVDQAAEVERLMELGALRPEWNYPADADFVVLADPDGNEFCIVQASETR